MSEAAQVDEINGDRKFADRVASICYETFAKLPKKGKPLLGKEWTILAAVCCLRKEDNDENLKVLALGTGSRCIGQNKLSSAGDLLNDSHAEVLARRAFLRYLYLEIEKTFSGNNSDILEFAEQSKQCKLKPHVSFIVFTSHTPCGDASIIPKEPNSDNSFEELQPCSELSKKNNSEHQPPEKRLRLDETVHDIHRTGAKCVQGGLQDSKLPGVEHHVVGVLRTKPGRGDQTLSMSCSDKLAKWNIVGLQGSLVMNFLTQPIYFSHLIIGKCPYNQEVMERAVSTRFSVHGQGCFIQQRPKILCSNNIFQYSKANSTEEASNDLKPCPSSVIWTYSSPDEVEVAVDGRKQGVTKKNIGKPSSRLKICKKNLFQSFDSLLRNIPDDRLPGHLRTVREEMKTTTYFKAKRLASNYFTVWEMTKEKVMPTWTKKDESLLHFTAQD